MLTCSNCGRENPPDARFCSGCGSPLAQPPARTETRKTVTVLFTDVTGSTSLGERLDPETVRQVMSRYFERMKTIVERHGGTVEKFIGDAVMAVFGVPVLHEDDALRAVRAAVEMRDALRSLNKELERDLGVTIAMRTGVNTGEVVTGDPAGEHLATGDAVNVAARLEQAASPGDVLIGDQTYRLTRAAVIAEELAPLELKGKERPVPAYRVVDVLAEAEGFERRLDSPMVGRDDELELLERAFRRAARERIGLLFTVLGSAGVGKSRLVQEFMRSLGDDGTVVRGRCLAYGEGITYWPITEIVKNAAGITEHDPPDEAIERITALLREDDQAATVAARVAEAVGVHPGTAPGEEIAWGVRRLFESLSRERPLVVVFDDIHWGEPTFLDLIEHVADWSRDAPILQVCLARQELLDHRPAWGGGKLNATTIQLEPLTVEQSTALVTHLLGESELEPDTAARITQAAEGNPLFVEQMLAMLIDDGLLVRRENRWVAAGRVDEVPVPPSIHALVAARLDRLGPEERAVIERAAVEGKVFHVGAVAGSLPGEAAAEVRSHLMALTRRELVRPDRPELEGEEAFRFRHQLIRDATYLAVPKQTRADLHERFAGWLEGKVGDRAAEYEEFLGYHLEQACRYRRELGQAAETTREIASRAAALLGAAGRRALGRGDSTAAVKLLRRARDLTVEPSPEFVALSIDLVDAAFGTGEFLLSHDAGDRAAAGAEQLHDEVLLARARIAQLGARAPTDPERFAEEVPRLVGDVMPILEAAGDHRGLFKAWQLLVFAANLAADRARMNDGIERMLVQARQANDRTMLVDALTERTANDYWGPMPVEEALRRAGEVVDELEDVPALQARSRMFVAGLLAMQGRFDEARQILTEVKEVWRERGDRLFLATIGFVAGPMEMLAGNPAAAEEDLRANCDALDALGERSLLCSLACLLAEALYQQGKYDEADDWADRGRGWAAEGDLEAQSDWRCVRAKVLARGERFDEARELVEEAVAIAERSDEIGHVGDAWADVAEVHRLSGRKDEARAAAHRAIEWYDRKGDIAGAAVVRRFLET